MRGFALFLVFVCFAAGVSFAQAPANPNSTASGTFADPYLVELERRARGNNDLLATSISDALRLKLDDYASQFLEALAKRKLNADDSARIARRISPERLLRVVVETQFTAPAKAQAQALLDALTAFDQSADRIAAAIPKLFSPVVDERLSSMRTLLGGGPESIAAISVAAAKELNADRSDELLRVLLRLGDEGSLAIRQLSLYGDANIRGGALQALIRLQDPLVKTIALAVIHDPQATPTESAVAAQWLRKRYPTLPTRTEAERYLADQLIQGRSEVSLIGDPETPVRLWSVTETRDKLAPSQARRIDAAWRHVVDHARLLHRLAEISLQTEQLAVGAELAYRYQIDPLTVDTGRKDVAALWGEHVFTGHSINELIRSALQSNDLATLVATVAAIDDSLQSEAETLMTTDSKVPTPLVVAASHGQPLVRYHAAQAIGRLGFAQPYAGSSDVMNRWLEMLELSREAKVILVETRLELSSQIESLFLALGYRVEVVATVKDAVLAVDRGGDLRYLVSTTVLPDRNSIELLDAVRRRPLGRELPVMFHGPLDSATEAAISDLRWPAPVVHAELPVTEAGLALILEPLDQGQTLPLLSAVERYAFRASAAEILGKIASQPELYAFYQYEKLAGMADGTDLASTQSSTVAFGEPLLSVLSVTASQESQEALADLTVQQGRTAEQRNAAADALLASFGRSGILLTSDDLTRLAGTRKSIDDQTAVALDRVLNEILRRTDAGGIGGASRTDRVQSKPVEKSVSPPDI